MGHSRSSPKPSARCLRESCAPTTIGADSQSSRCVANGRCTSVMRYSSVASRTAGCWPRVPRRERRQVSLDRLTPCEPCALDASGQQREAYAVHQRGAPPAELENVARGIEDMTSAQGVQRGRERRKELVASFPLDDGPKAGLARPRPEQHSCGQQGQRGKGRIIAQIRAKVRKVVRGRGVDPRDTQA